MHEWLAVLQGASFVGLLIVSAFSGIQAARVAGLRGDREDLTKRLDLRDKELAEEKAERARERKEDQAKIAELSAAVDVLRATVTGEVHLVALEDVTAHMSEAIVQLTAALAQHHEAAMAELHALMAVVGETGRSA